MENSMLKEGKYSVWMRTPLAEGLGVVMLAPDGRLCGRDTIMSYTGHWRAEGEQFEANVSAVRHSTGRVRGIRQNRCNHDRSDQGRCHRLMHGHRQTGTGSEAGGHARPHGGRPDSPRGPRRARNRILPKSQTPQSGPAGAFGLSGKSVPVECRNSVSQRRATLRSPPKFRSAPPRCGHRLRAVFLFV